MEKKCILISAVGKTDPIRSNYDGPMLHIVRHYQPEKVYLILSDDIAKKEEKWGQNETAIHFLDKQCEVIKDNTEIKNPHSYDDLTVDFRRFCEKVKKENPERKILLNITSGTPQMKTTLAMIGMGEPEIYTVIQVTSPEGGKTYGSEFDPEKEDLKDWFECDIDNEESDANRCVIPNLYNFRQPMIQFQIQSLLENYNYAGAYTLYNLNRDILPEKLGHLLRHGAKRYNLEFEEAVLEARKCNMSQELFENSRKDITELVDYFNAMQIKVKRGELNDFVLRLEVLAVYLSLFIIEKKMRIPLDDFSTKRKRKGSETRYLDEQKCKKIMPEIEKYFMENYFEGKSHQRFEWGRDLNGRAAVNIVGYQSEYNEKHAKYKIHVEEMRKWIHLSAKVRNPAAHTIIAILPEKIREEYEGKSAEMLCANIRKVMVSVLGKEVPKEIFDVFDILNQCCIECMRGE